MLEAFFSPQNHLNYNTRTDTPAIDTRDNISGAIGVFGITTQMFLFTIMGSFGASSYAPLSVFLKPAFNLSAVQIGSLTSSVFAGSIISFIYSGYLIDYRSSAFAMRVSFILISTGSAILAFGFAYYQLIAGYLLVGMGYGFITPATNSMIMSARSGSYPVSLGIKQAGVPLGALLSSLILPFIALRLSLRFSLLTITIASAVVLLSLRRFPDHEGISRKFHTYLRDSLIRPLRNRSLLIISSVAIPLSWAQQTLLTYYALSVTAQNHNPERSILLLSVLLSGAVAGRIIWGVLGRTTFNRRRFGQWALIIMLSGSLIFALPYAIRDQILLVPYAFATGMNALSWNSTYVTLVSETAPRGEVGTYSGLSLFLVAWGTIVGTPLSGIVVDLTHSYSVMWMLVGGSLLMLSLITYTLIRPLFERGLHRTFADPHG